MAIVNLNKSNATNYQLIFPKLPVEKYYEKSKYFTLNIFGTVVPSLTLDVEEKNWQGGKSFTDTGNLSYGTWNLNFTIDSEFRNWKVLYDWIIRVNNNENDYGEVRGKDLTIDGTLLVMNNYRDTSLKLYFHNIWPYELGEVSFDKRNTDDDLICNATFMYDKYEIDNK